MAKVIFERDGVSPQGRVFYGPDALFDSVSVPAAGGVVTSETIQIHQFEGPALVITAFGSTSQNFDVVMQTWDLPGGSAPTPSETLLRTDNLALGLSTGGGGGRIGFIRPLIPAAIPLNEIWMVRPYIRIVVTNNDPINQLIGLTCTAYAAPRMGKPV